jgi:hypothetical protein
MVVDEKDSDWSVLARRFDHVAVALVTAGTPSVRAPDYSRQPLSILIEVSANAHSYNRKRTTISGLCPIVTSTIDRKGTVRRRHATPVRGFSFSDIGRPAGISTEPQTSNGS